MMKTKALASYAFQFESRGGQLSWRAEIAARDPTELRMK